VQPAPASSYEGRHRCCFAAALQGSISQRSGAFAPRGDVKTSRRQSGVRESVKHACRAAGLWSAAWRSIANPEQIPTAPLIAAQPEGHHEGASGHTPPTSTFGVKRDRDDGTGFGLRSWSPASPHDPHPLLPGGPILNTARGFVAARKYQPGLPIDARRFPIIRLLPSQDPHDVKRQVESSDDRAISKRASHSRIDAEVEFSEHWTRQSRETGTRSRQMRHRPSVRSRRAL